MSEETSNFEQQWEDAIKMANLQRALEKKICAEIKRRDPAANISFIHDSINVETKLSPEEVQQIRDSIT